MCFSGKNPPAIEVLYVYVSTFPDSPDRLVLVWFERRLAALVMLAITVGILMFWFRVHATNHLNLSL
ncbi:DUF5993 family protein [Polynucleobacter necessarius]|uniref:DUF5993 family protein n=1 Tax=Polynucleobacter necessarius TaxID=576610 RepID=UPI0039E54AFC